MVRIETPHWLAEAAPEIGGNLYRLLHLGSGLEILRAPPDLAELRPGIIIALCRNETSDHWLYNAIKRIPDHDVSLDATYSAEGETSRAAPL